MVGPRKSHSGQNRNSHKREKSIRAGIPIVTITTTKNHHHFHHAFILFTSPSKMKDKADKFFLISSEACRPCPTAIYTRRKTSGGVATCSIASWM